MAKSSNSLTRLDSQCRLCHVLIFVKGILQLHFQFKKVSARRPPQSCSGKAANLSPADILPQVDWEDVCRLARFPQPHSRLPRRGRLNDIRLSSGVAGGGSDSLIVSAGPSYLHGVDVLLFTWDDHHNMQALGNAICPNRSPRLCLSVVDFPSILCATLLACSRASCSSLILYYLHSLSPPCIR